MQLSKKTDPLYLVVLLLVVAGLVGPYLGYFNPLFKALTEETTEIKNGRENIFWAINQLNAEFANLRHVTNQERLKRPKYSDIFFTYEMTLGQADLLQQGDLRDQLEETGIPLDTIDEANRLLFALEPIVEKAENGDDAALKEISDQLTSCLGLIRQFAQTSSLSYQEYLRGKRMETTAQIDNAKQALIVATTVMVVLIIILSLTLKFTIRARKEAEEQRLKAEQSASAKARFLAAMSHEIRTPLNAVIGFADLSDYDEDEVDPEELRENMQFIRNAGEQLSTLINGILDWSKIDSNNLVINKEPVAISYLISDFHKLYQQIAMQQGLTLEAEISPDFPEYQLTDSTRVNQILTNLVGNSIKFTEAGKCIWITASATDTELRIAVKDQGIGIAKEKLQLIFNEFVQADSSTTREYGGTGLGLAISRELASLMGGDIEVESEEGVGSTFTLVLKRESPESAGEWNARPLSNQPTTHAVGPAKILVVEDGAVNRKLLQAMLEKFDMRPVLAADGAEGVELAKTECPDVIIMDLQMPEMDGVEATRRIREIPEIAQTPILVLSANTFDEDRAKAQAVGVDGFLEKPIKPDVLRDALSRHIPVQEPEKVVNGA